MAAFADIIGAFGGPLAFSREIGIPASHARAMKTRNSIAPRYWPILIKRARKRGIFLSEETLVALYAQRWPRTARAEAA